MVTRKPLSFEASGGASRASLSGWRPYILKRLLMRAWKERFLRRLLLGLINLLSSDIRDVDTGERIGRALLVPCRGRILILGAGVAGYSWVPKFYSQKRLTFWKCELGFTRHPEPDYSHEPCP